jgi:hypothetical protein
MLKPFEKLQAAEMSGYAKTAGEMTMAYLKRSIQKTAKDLAQPVRRDK